MAGLKNNVSVELDDLDIKILCMLLEDSRLSFHKIAKRLKVSVGTVQKRAGDLENRGFLKGYTAILDPVKLGYTMTTVIFVQTEGGHHDYVENLVAKAVNVISMYEITGDFDLVIIAKFKENSDLISFIKQLLLTRFVRRTATDIALNIMKEDDSSLVIG